MCDLVSIAPQSPKAVRPSTSAMPRKRTQGQGIAPGAKGPKGASWFRLEADNVSNVARLWSDV